MRYFGSKGSVVRQIGKVVARTAPKGSFCDPFGGIGIVGRHLKSLGHEVISGDVLRFATMFQTSSLCRSRKLSFSRIRAKFGIWSEEDIVHELNLEARNSSVGWFADHYAIKRRFFTVVNAQAIERSWHQIVGWHKSGLTTQLEHAILMASLIDSMDRVANTAGTYYAFLKTYSRKALKPFQFRMLPAIGGPKGSVFHADALDIVKLRHYDILYLDPPYNERDYTSYYHLPETVANGKQVNLIGQCGIPVERNKKSRFTRPAMALQSIEELITEARFTTLLFHYADDGLVSSRDLKKLLSSFGKIEAIPLTALGYRTTAGTRQAQHRLYVVKNA